MKACRIWLFFSLLCGIARVSAAEWILPRLPGEADEHAYDLASVYIFADEVTYWHRIRKAEGISPVGKRLLRERIQCTYHTLTTLTEIDYDRQGHRIRVATPLAREPLKILPESTEAVLEQAICRLIGRKGGRNETITGREPKGIVR